MSNEDIDEYEFAYVGGLQIKDHPEFFLLGSDPDLLKNNTKKFQ